VDISYAPDNTAAVVCNHLGATDFFNPAQSDVDTAVLNAVNNEDLVGCVAMDYMVSSGVNNNQPFIRLLIFGSSGQLLPSVNLDGRREKFVPGTCHAQLPGHLQPLLVDLPEHQRLARSGDLAHKLS
jgi:hypothetical protein